MALADEQQKLLAEMKRNQEKAIAQQQSLPASQRVQPMPPGKADFPIGLPESN